MTVEETIIRNAANEDVPRIADIGRRTFKSSFGHSMPESDMQAYLDETYSVENIQKELCDSSCIFFVAARQDTVHGFVQLKLGTTEPCLPTDVHLCEIYRLYVDHEHHSGGLGQLILSHAISWIHAHFSSASSSSAKRLGVWLGVWDENYKAQKFYKRHGFGPADSSHDFKMGSTTQTDLIYVKWLT